MQAGSRSSLVLLAGLLAGGAGGSCGPSRPPLEPPRNVLLVVVDTLAARHVGIHDGEVALPPQFDLLRERRTTVFPRSYSPAPWTKPALGSIFTGLYPSEHGLTDMPHAFDPPVPTLAERLGEGGIETHGIVSHTLIREGTGFERGFDDYRNVNRQLFPHDTITSPDVTDAALGWLDARAEAGDQASPFLLFLHYFDPHYAYHHHEAHDRSAWYEGELTPQTHFETLLDRARGGELSGEDFRYLRSLHAEEVAFTQEHVGRLLAGMAERGLLQDTLILFTADHGEEFGGHGSVGHTKTLYDELIDVPLVVSLPGEPALEVVDEVVSTVDILPTLLDLHGLPPAERGSGRSLVRLLRDPTARLGRQGVYAEVAYTPEERRAFQIARIERSRKLIYDQDAQRYELYDLDADPLEQNDLFDPERFDQERMMHALESFQDFVQGAASGDGARLEFDAQELEELRRLGYL